MFKIGQVCYEADNGTNHVGTGGAETEATTVDTSKKYSQEEVDKLLQAEADRRVTAALKKKDAEKAAAIKEAEKLARMNEEEKYKYELDQREKAIAEKEKQLSLSENKATAAAILAEKGISTSLVDFVVAEDADTMNSNIKILERAFNQSVKLEVEKRLGSTTPKKNLPLDKAVTKESFAKMTLAEQMEIYNNNPTLYKELTK